MPKKTGKRRTAAQRAASKRNLELARARRARIHGTKQNAQKGSKRYKAMEHGLRNLQGKMLKIRTGLPKKGGWGEWDSKSTRRHKKLESGASVLLRKMGVF